jgi:hypothetical protein
MKKYFRDLSVLYRLATIVDLAWVYTSAKKL